MYPLSPQLDAFIVRMPKIELHVHLEGSISSRTLRELAQRNGISIPVRNSDDTAQLYYFQNFIDFLKRYRELLKAIVSGEDFERLAYELGMVLAHQNVVYAEVMLSPVQHILRGMDMHEVLAGTSAGFARAERERGIMMRIALDYGRQYGPDGAWPLLEVARKADEYGLVGWSIGGNEIGHPPEQFAEVYAAAHDVGLHLMAHAGEVAGSESVWGAVDVLKVQRVGHGIRSIDDPRLMEHLRAHNIVLDICPSSNVYTGAVKSWTEHPLPQLYKSGVPVTINTDDPSFFATTLTSEFRHVVRHFGFTIDDLCQLVRTSAAACFLPPAPKRRLQERVDRELQQLREEMGI